MAELVAEVRRAISAAAPADVLRTGILRLAGLLDAQAQCWLADYQEAVMLPALDEATEPADPEVFRVYAAQLPQQRRSRHQLRAYWPLAVRGARWGVLQLTFSADLAGEHAHELADVGARTDIADAVRAIAEALSLVMPLTDDFHRLRRSRSMTVAAEMQWALLPPAGSYAEPGLQVAGALEPAYSVSGDCFDFSRDAGVLDVAVFDGMGRGVPASVATTLSVNAYRNARRSDVPLGEQASLADQALYAHLGGQQYVAAVLLRLHVGTGELEVVDAGSPLILLLRGRDCAPLPLEPQLPLGMFEETVYTVQRHQLEPGDRLIIVSDGVHEARSPGGAAFSAQQLTAVARSTGLLNAAETARHMIRSLHLHTGGTPLDGDAAVVCLDWSPVPASPEPSSLSSALSSAPPTDAPSTDAPSTEAPSTEATTRRST